MNTKDLFFRDDPIGVAPRAIACGVCNRIWSTDEVSARLAVECCDPTCAKCGSQKGGGPCLTCGAEHWRAVEIVAFHKAEKVSRATYVGAVYDPASERFYGALDECMEESEDEPPAYVWTCVTRRIRLDASHIAESAVEDTFEDAELDNYAELAAFVESFNAKLNQTWWEPDQTRAIVIDASRCPA